MKTKKEKEKASIVVVNADTEESRKEMEKLIIEIGNCLNLKVTNIRWLGKTKKSTKK